MTKIRKRHHIEYKQDHKLAKFIVACVVSCLFLIGTYSGHILFDTVAIWVWFFGVNATQYLIEILRCHKHKVDKL